jgi:hypothetical protein
MGGVAHAKLMKEFNKERRGTETFYLYIFHQKSPSSPLIEDIPEGRIFNFSQMYLHVKHTSASD